MSVPIARSGRSADAEYPVVGSTSLLPATRRWLILPPKRSLDDLPPRPAGSVLVFQADGRYVVAPRGTAMLRSAEAVHAEAAVVISTRQETVAAVVPLPSTSRDCVVLEVGFHCRVLDPISVLEAGCYDVRPQLESYLLDDDVLRMLGARDDVAANPEVAKRILARIFARMQLEPPDLPGISAAVAGTRVRIQTEIPHQRRATEDFYTHHDHTDRLTGSTPFGPVGGDFDSSLPGDAF
ncbi:hypothetical protein AB0H83_13295 [Dactylosporangium sp. NPDC050688]|uniref:hypothetical protein n=1 Tax=Dactylosporangium sp. NPDC050688 TaxID=3157217 RepID=UPI0033C48389